MFKPSVISIDFETNSLSYWSPEFKVLSIAAVWRDAKGHLRDRYAEGDEIETLLQKIATDGIPVVVHNLSFEYGVIRHVYPHLYENLQFIDTMRLAQVYDNGGDKADKLSGYSLAKCVQRILGRPDPKARFYEELHLKGVKRGEEGSQLTLLGPTSYREYNIQDAEETLRLYEHITTEFVNLGYDWALDHQLYVGVTKRISDAQAKGVAIDPLMLEAARISVGLDIGNLDVDVRKKYLGYITTLESQLAAEYVAKFKSDKGRDAALTRPHMWAFNPKSTLHLKRLFLDVMGMQATHTTPKGKPSFKSSHLYSYGEPGQMLTRRNSLLLLKTQIESLLEKSQGGRWHLGLKACGTATGRFAGTGGLNAQGLARREECLMGCIVADPGHSFVSVDLSSGEPTATCHYSGDKNYYDAIFGMVGQDPYFDTRGVLKCDDIYLTAASFSPLGADMVRYALAPDGVVAERRIARDIFETAKKNQLKKVRELHKILVLGIAYMMGPKKMVQSCRDKGFDISLKDAKSFYNAYWTWCPDVRKLSNTLTEKLERDGYLVNDFGYRLLPDAPHKAFNYWIQSTVSGVMNALTAYFFSLCPEAQFVTVIHDELIFQVPDALLTDAQTAMDKAVEQLNADLSWDVKVRTGWAVGKTLYEAK